jgi:N-formylglutamate amidohydrolase
MPTMTAIPAQQLAPFPRPYRIARPTPPRLPVVFSSPHSGRSYPPEFLAASALDLGQLRRSEDGFVDELFAAAPLIGAPLLHALFPRAYLDANREPYELDPAMFADTLPSFVNARSARVHEGFGTIPRLVTGGLEIYRRKLTFAEAHARIEALYRPYHAALATLLAETYARFGEALLIDCHSMPSPEWIPGRPWPARRPDVVLGDRFGASCDPAIVDWAEASLRARGLGVERNAPFAGGFITAHYGHPRAGIYALQIELNRALYMDQVGVVKHDGFARLKDALTGLMAGLGAALARERAA